MKKNIEIELKFILTPEQEQLLIQNAKFINEIEFVDIYYDTLSYTLSTNDIWLRSRNGKFVLKYPIINSHKSLKTQNNSPKNEIEDENEIRKMLSISCNSSLHQELINAKIIPLYKFKNIRRTYQIEEFRLDLDKAIFDDFEYEICEIETLVSDQSEIDHAIKKVTEFARSYGLTIKTVEGKLIELLRRKYPDHYRLLKK